MRTVPLGPGAEFDRIRAFLEPSDGTADSRTELVGPGDDAAVVDGFVVSVDLTVEGIHFEKSWLSARDIGYRAVAAAGSDLAAMAATPVGILVALGLPRGADDEFIAQLRAGFQEACRMLDAPLLGGDLSASPGLLFLDVTVLGRSDRPVLRTGAVPGDELWVTGTLGGSAAAVAEHQAGREPSEPLQRAYAHPLPRTREALWLQERGLLRALIDLSDGLAGDTAHLAAASGVAVVLDEARVPVNPALRGPGGSAPAAARTLALHGGEDYELCFVTSPDTVREQTVTAFESRFSVPLSRIGSIEAGSGVHLRRIEGGEAIPLDRGGFDHFGKHGSGRP